MMVCAWGLRISYLIEIMLLWEINVVDTWDGSCGYFRDVVIVMGRLFNIMMWIMMWIMGKGLNCLVIVWEDVLGLNSLS